MGAVLSFAVAYRVARNRTLLPRECCACGCGRTVSAVDRVCMFIPKGESERRVYYDETCFFEGIQKRGASKQ